MGTCLSSPENDNNKMGDSGNEVNGQADGSSCRASNSTAAFLPQANYLIADERNPMRKELLHKIDDQDTKIKQLDDELADSKNEINRLSEKSEELLKKMQAMEQNLSKEKADNTNLSRDLNICREALSNTQQSHMATQSSLKDKNKELDDVKTEISSLNGNLADTKIIIKSLESELNEKKRIIEQIEESLSQKEIQITNLRRDNKKLTDQFNSLTQRSNQLEKDLALTKEMMAAGEKSLNNYLKKESESRDNQIQSYFNERSELKKTHDTLRKENDQLRNEKQILMNQNEELKEKLSKTSVSIKNSAEFQKEIDDLKDENRRCQQDWLTRKNKYEEEIMNLKQSQQRQELNFEKDDSILDTKIRSFVRKFFKKLCTSAKVEDDKIEDYLEELSNEKLSLIELLQKAESFTKEQRIT